MFSERRKLRSPKEHYLFKVSLAFEERWKSKLVCLRAEGSPHRIIFIFIKERRRGGEGAQKYTFSSHGNQSPTTIVHNTHMQGPHTLPTQTLHPTTPPKPFFQPLRITSLPGLIVVRLCISQIQTPTLNSIGIVNPSSQSPQIPRLLLLKQQKATARHMLCATSCMLPISTISPHYGMHRAYKLCHYSRLGELN